MSRKSNEIYKLIFSSIQSLSQNQEQVAKGGGGRSTPQTITVVGGREELLSTKNVEFFFGTGAQRRKLPHDLHGAQPAKALKTLDSSWVLYRARSKFLFHG